MNLRGKINWIVSCALIGLLIGLWITGHAEKVVPIGILGLIVFAIIDRILINFGYDE